MITLNTLDAAIDEAKRFLSKAKAARRRLLEENPKRERNWAAWGTKESGAARRASMDLSRVLADLRRP